MTEVLRPRPQVVKERIRASKIMARLEAFVLEENDPTTKKPVSMTQAQVRAALGLIAKVVPDVKYVEHSGNITLEHQSVQATARWLEQAIAATAVGDPAEPRTH